MLRKILTAIARACNHTDFLLREFDLIIQCLIALVISGIAVMFGVFLIGQILGL